MGCSVLPHSFLFFFQIGVTMSIKISAFTAAMLRLELRIAFVGLKEVLVSSIHVVDGLRQAYMRHVAQPREFIFKWL